MLYFEQSVTQAFIPQGSLLVSTRTHTLYLVSACHSVCENKVDSSTYDAIYMA